MKRMSILVVIIVGVALLAGISVPADSDARELTIVSWGGSYQEAQRKAFFDPFIKKTGKKILDESYNGELAKIKAMVEAKNVTWDVVQVEAPELINACEEGLLEIIDWNRVGGKKSFIPAAGWVFTEAISRGLTGLVGFVHLVTARSTSNECLAC